MTTGRKRSTHTARLEQRRMEAAQMFAADARTVEVARTFGVAWRTAFKWRQAFAAKGIDGLRSRGRPGREPLLDAPRRRRLRTILKAGATRCGFPDNTWTLTRVQAVVGRVFGITCSRSSIWRMLRQSRATKGIAARPDCRAAPRAASAPDDPAAARPETRGSPTP